MDEMTMSLDTTEEIKSIKGEIAWRGNHYKNGFPAHRSLFPDFSTQELRERLNVLISTRGLWIRGGG